jgi:hypothetical protein
MMRQIQEADWKIFRPLHKPTLERFCERILEELGQLNADISTSAHDRYLKIFRRIEKSDNEIMELFNDVRRSTAWQQIALMSWRGLFTEEEFSRFSEEVHEIVALYNSR